MATSTLIVITFTCDAEVDADNREPGQGDICLAEFKVDNDGWTNLTLTEARRVARDAGWSFGKDDTARCVHHRRRATDAWPRH